MLALGTVASAHPTSSGHPERPERVSAVLDGLVEAGLHDAIVPVAPRRATEAELLRVHTHAHLDRLRTVCAAGGGWIDDDTAVGPTSFDAAVEAAGAALAVVEACGQGTADVGLVAARPPGHHATGDQAMGFCLVNTVAVAAAALAEAGERVLVLDWDVHHGNGTQAIFWDDPRVLYASTHQHPLYPGTGGVHERGGPQATGTTVNVPVPPGATGDIVLQAVDEVVLPVAERFAPTWVLVSAGFDAHRADPLADLALSAGDFARLADRARRLAPGPGRLVLVLEGGYDLHALRLSAGAAVAATLEVPYRPEPATAGGPGSGAVAHARRVHLQGDG
jgi:acetoin utilization deacetylase AcuC-like enzyme